MSHNTLHPLLLNIPNTRYNNLTHLTDDPGNTELHMYFIPLTEEDDYDFTRLQNLINTLTDEHLTSMGDHSEEAITITQNNELILIINLNK